jgi:hypothetical protein
VFGDDIVILLPSIESGRELFADISMKIIKIE